MTKKFTEEEYQKITNYFDDLNDRYGLGLLASNLVDEIFKKFIRDYEYQLYWQELVAIMDPITRDWAHNQFVEKEKKYYWKSVKRNDNGEGIVLKKLEFVEGGLIVAVFSDGNGTPLTKPEIKEWGYNPDMFIKEEVE